MPTSSIFLLEKPKSYDEFEEMVEDCAPKRWNRKFMRYGRSGQKQHGIDLYSDDWEIVIQCKNYEDFTHDLQKKISDDYHNAVSKFGNIKLFVIATTLKNDTKIHDFIGKFPTEKNAASKTVRIEVLLWEQIEEYISTDPALVKKFCRLVSNNSIVYDIQALINFLDERLENIRRNHPSFQLMNIDASLFPDGRPELNDIKVLNFSKETKSISEIFKDSWACEKNNLIITGEGGIGKTVTLLSLTANTENLPHKVPAIYIQLHELTNTPSINTIEDFIRVSTLYNEENQQNQITMYEQILAFARQPWNNGPNILFLIDGFNEVPPEHRQSIGAEINLWSEMPGVQIVISSRFDVRHYISLKGNYCTVCLQPLTKDTIAQFLQKADVAIPDNDVVWDVISYPLMLTLYVKTKRVIAKRDNNLLAWKSVNNAGTLIWNYLQCELWRFQGNSLYMLKCVLSTEFIAPYIAWKMQLQHKFSIELSEFRLWLNEAVQLFELISEAQQPRHIQDILWEYGKNEIDPKELYGFLLSDLCLFVRREKGFVSLMHQQFRDSLSAIHLMNLAYMMQENGPLPTEWRKSIDYYVMNFAAQLLEPDLAKKLWNANRRMDPLDRISTSNLMELFMRRNNYDFSALDFSCMDLSRIHLHGYHEPEGTHLRLPVSAEKMHKTTLSVETFMPEGHSSIICAIAAAPDNLRFVSASDDGTLIIWDINTGRTLHVLAGHDNAVNDVVITSDSLQCISGSSDKTLRVWNMNTGDSSAPLKGHTDEVLAVAVCPDDQHFASASKDGTIRLWNLNDRNAQTVVPIFEKQKIRCIFREQVMNNNYFFCVSTDGRLRIWDVSSNNFLPSIDAFFGNIYEMTLSPDGMYFISSTDSGLQLWNITSGQTFYNPTIFETFAISSDSRKVIGGTVDGTLQILSIPALIPIKSYCLSEGITSMAITQDQKRCIVSLGASYQIIDLYTGKPLYQLPETYLQTGEVRLTADGSRCICGSNPLKVWDVETGKQIWSSMGREIYIDAIAITPDNKQFVSASSDGLMRLWDLKRRKLIGFFENPAYIIKALAITLDGTQCIGISAMGVIQTWDMETRKLINSKKVSDVWLSTAAITSSGQSFAGVNHRTENDSRQEQMLLWNMKNDDVPRELQYDNCTAMALSADGKQLIYASNKPYMETLQKIDLLCDTIVPICWQAPNRTHNLTDDQINSISVTPDGRLIAFGTCNEIVIWHEDTKKPQFFPGYGWVHAVAISSDGKYCISGSENNLFIWDINKGKCVSMIRLIPSLDLLDVNLSQAEFENEYDAEILYQNGAII